ncbi:MAG: acetolactate synthase-1/3 small subunit [Parvicella sp.]|jgi:acetolactate synthase-1/3 small subunit
MKENFTLSIFTENQVGLLNRVTIIFTRRKINIESIAASESEVDGVHRYTIVINETEEQVKKVVAQLEKQVEVLKAFYHLDEQLVYQEIALYKIPTQASLENQGSIERLTREHNARLISFEKDFIVIEKTGHNSETTTLFNALKPFGLLEFVRSGRVAISKPMKTLNSYIKELEELSKN